MKLLEIAVVLPGQTQFKTIQLNIERILYIKEEYIIDGVNVKAYLLHLDNGEDLMITSTTYEYLCKYCNQEILLKE